jgi:hypothetical protein
MQVVAQFEKDYPSGAEAHVSLEGVVVRAEARTLHAKADILQMETLAGFEWTQEDVAV